jgi:YVTN family beta-propeller protein
MYVTKAGADPRSDHLWGHGSVCRSNVAYDARLHVDDVLNSRGSEILSLTSRRGQLTPVGNRVWGIAFDLSRTKLYTANDASNDVSVVDLKSRKELRRIKVGDGPWGIAIVPKITP